MVIGSVIQSIARSVGHSVGRRSASRGWTPQNIDGLNFWANKRTGLTINGMLGNNATIMPAVAKVDGSNYCRAAISQFGNVSSGYIEARVYHTAGENTIIFGTSSESNATNYCYLYIGTTNKPTIGIRSGTTDIFYNAYTTSNAISEGWHTVRFGSTGSNYYIWLDGAPVAGSAAAGSDNGKWLNLILNRANITFGYLKMSATLHSGNGLHKLSWVDFNGTNYWNFTGKGKYEYDRKLGVNPTWTGTAHVAYDVAEGSYLFDTGFSLYSKAGEPNEYVPYTSIGVPYDASVFLSGYTKQFDRLGSSTEIVAAPSIIDFDPENETPVSMINYDRSNTTVCNALARAGSDYDETNSYRWLIEDVLNPETYYSWKNPGYETRIYAAIDRVLGYPSKVNAFYSFDRFINSAEKYRIEVFCNIDGFFFKAIENRVTVKVDGTGDFTTIQAAINDISDAGASKIYCIEVYDDYSASALSDYTVEDGSYRRFIALKDYVYLQAMGGRRNINCTLPATVTNDQVSFYENMVCNAQSGVYNFLITQRNGRYALHIDGSGAATKTQRFDKSHFTHYGVQDIIDYRIANSQSYTNLVGLNAVGTGSYTGQRMLFNDCTINSIKPIGFHTNVAFSNPSTFILNRCTLISEQWLNTNYNPTSAKLENMNLYCLTSEVDNPVVINNCDLNSYIYYSGSYHNTTKTNLYILGDISVVSYGTELDFRNFFTDQGSLRITSANVGGSVHITGGTAASVIMPSSDDADNYSTGRLEVGNWSRNANIKLGVRLGDCSGVAKTLEMSIDGGGTTTITFNEDFTAQTNTQVLAFINTALAGSAVATLYQRASEVEPVILT